MFRQAGKGKRALLILLLLTAAPGIGIRAQELRRSHKPKVADGRSLFNAGCSACHGVDGNGAPQQQTEFKRPHTFPDFTACSGTTPETDANWKAVITYGGPGMGYSHIMPSFDKELSSDQMDDLIAYLRTLCTDAHWPRGELNLPRALVTEKAYPEREFVVSTVANATGSPGWTTDFIQEQSIGPRGQLEIDVPWDYQKLQGSWYSHTGDMTIGWKQVMFSSLRTGSILSLQGGLLPPTGSRKLGGNGTTVFEPFLAFDQLFPTNTWIQFQMGSDLPRHPGIAPQSLFFNTAFGQTWTQLRGLGRQWSPMVEMLGNRDLINGAKTDWDVLPEMQVTLSKRQHIRADLGVRRPFTDTAGRSTQVTFYVLWDWQDGSFWEGWK
ncbi:MAG TPA: cytochrome c [Acidobacteriaceae bacterium]|nr:cytochrome c [Acidobacteriaceae bacterium]